MTALLPSLAILRGFEAAAKHESFTRAAEELRVTQGAVSRMVRDLEGIVGVALFRQAGRGVVLTEAGRNLATRLSGDLGRLRHTVETARAAGETGRTLSIATLPSFGSHWLAPRLPRFKAAAPNVELTIVSRSHPFDIAGEGLDLAIHFGRREWVDGVLTELCPEYLVAVASPELVASQQIENPRDIECLPLLHLQTRSSAWPVYFDWLDLDPALARRGTVFDQFAALIAAAIHGLGAAIVPAYLIEAEMARGSLVEIGRPETGGDMYYVVTPKGIANPAAESFREWVSAEAQSSSRRRLTGLI